MVGWNHTTYVSLEPDSYPIADFFFQFVVIAGERTFLSRTLPRQLKDIHCSCKLCCLRIRPSYFSYPVGGVECHHWVSPPCFSTRHTVTIELSSAILASWFLQEELGHIGRLGCALCIIGSVIIILHAPEDKEIRTVDEVLQYAIQPGNLYIYVTLPGSK